MTFYDELYFEVTVTGAKAEVRKLAQFLLSGELDEFFEVTRDYISYDDNYEDASDTDKTSLVFTDDDLGVEIDEFNVGEFLEVFCRAATRLDVTGRFYDAEDEEFSFVSPEGDDEYTNAKKIKRFNDELDEERDREEDLSDDED